MIFRYVDEAQDNMLVDALSTPKIHVITALFPTQYRTVLRSLSRNPANGLFWAGDTAQTISAGSAFRFDDLKAFLYRVDMAVCCTSL